MKLTNFLVGIMFLSVLFFPFGINQKTLMLSNDLIFQYNEAVRTASEDAASELIKPKDNDSLEVISDGSKINYEKTNLNLDQALWRFYQSLYINLGIENNYSAQQAFKNKVPLKLAVGYDGYYVNTWQEEYVNDTLQIHEGWLSKKLYSMIDNKYNIKIRFTLDDTVTVVDLSNNTQITDKQSNFITKYPESCFGPRFNEVKTHVINKMIKDDLSYYTYYNNNIAKKNGWKLNFNIPTWGDRAVNDIAFVAFVQGKVVEGTNAYNTYGFGTAKIVKRKAIYGYEKNGHNLYSVNKEGSNLTSFNSEYEAAKNGYSPDPAYYMNFAQGATDTANTVKFSVINNDGIPLMKLNPTMDFQKDYILKYNTNQRTITKDDIGNDGSVLAIPKSLAKDVQMSFADSNPFKFSFASSIDLGMDTGDTPPEITVKTSNFEGASSIKFTLQTRDLDIGDNVSFMYRLLDANTGNKLSGYVSDMNILDSTKLNNLTLNSLGNKNTLTGYINCPPTGNFKVEIWAVDNHNISSQVKKFSVVN